MPHPKSLNGAAMMLMNYVRLHWMSMSSLKMIIFTNHVYFTIFCQDFYEDFEIDLVLSTIFTE